MNNDLTIVGGTHDEMLSLAARIMARPCEDCVAEVTVISRGNATFLSVAHDDTCPSLHAINRNRAARRAAKRQKGKN
ncbi:hypothetical protein [Pseudarthrobacter sp. fls2-241-R2A-127]|uniref:hypothetical protein n=1 Tax=Pseudarthrobacter sp. fls2-241-R2A-127 TaxID=3040303 RepID=UPI0025544FB6|nr:hypothetical protein [Pseudarthrobacter sp. fls2-241-R2A-127]